MLSEAQLDELLARVENGEGVNAIITDMGLLIDVELEWLKSHARSEVKDAKLKQRMRNDR